MSEIFISYARSTTDQARRIAEALRALGYSAWRDDELPPHRPYAEVIAERLDQAKAVLVLWSDDAVRSEWVRSEANRAREEKKLVQMSLDGVAPPMPFDQIHCTELTGWSGDPLAPAWQRRLQSIGERVGRGPAALEEDAPASEPSGHRLGPAAPLPTTEPRRRGGRLAWVAAVLLLIIVLAAGGALFWSSRTTPDLRVAVLPFEASPAGSTSQALAVRTRDQIVGVLTARQIEVASASSSKGARLLVGGVVEQTGGVTRVRVHVDDPSSQTVLWQRDFEGDGGADSPLPERAAAKVTDLITSAANVIRSSKGKIRPDALKVWILGVDGGRDGQVIETMEFYRAFRAKAPNLSVAHSAYATVTWAAAQDQTPEVARAWRAEAQAAAKQALQLDAGNASAYFVLSQMELSLAGRQKWLSEGLKHRPNDGSLNTSEGVLLASAGRLAEAVPFLRRGLALDPLSPQKNFGTAGSLAAAGFADEGRDLLTHAHRIWPKGPNELGYSLQFAVNSMSPDEGLQMLAELQRTYPTFSTEAGIWRPYFESLKCKCGQTAAAQRIDAAVAAGHGPLGLALPALSRLGETGLAYQVAERDKPQLTRNEFWLLFGPATAPMRRDPRFMDIAARAGLAEFWRTSNRWPDFCAEPGLPYDCKVEAARAVAQLKKP